MSQPPAFAPIFLIALFLIIYGSLYPFQFHPLQTAGNPFWILLHSWPVGFDRFLLKDAVLNAWIYIPLGVFGSLWKAKVKARPDLPTAALITLLALILSASIEMLQLFDDHRTCSALDVSMNVLGAAIGVGVARLYHGTLIRLCARPTLATVFQPSASMLLLCSWIGFQIFPLIPQFSTTQLSLKLAALGRGDVMEPVQTIGSVIDWLAVARLLQLVRSPGWVLPALMLTLPARLFIVGRSLTLPEIFGALCAWIFWARWLHRSPLRGVLLAWAATAALLFRGLMPFRWSSTPTAFTWWPFIAFMDSGMVSGANFLNKTFLYGAAIRLFTDNGYSYARTAVFISAILGVIEWVQIHLPGRTPEITDPLYALILAVVLKLLDRADTPANPGRRSIVVS